jgi:hypothetical protein
MNHVFREFSDSLLFPAAYKHAPPLKINNIARDSFTYPFLSPTD